MDFFHSLPVQIRFNDADPAQHINNSVYQEYFDLGRMSYFKTVMGSFMDFGSVSLVIASFKVDFYQPVFFQDQITVQTKISSIGTKSIEMTQQIMCEGEPAPRALSTSILVCYDYCNKVSEVLPEEWKEKIRAYEGIEMTGD